MVEHPSSKHISINFALGPDSRFLKPYFGVIIWFGMIDDSTINSSVKYTSCIVKNPDDLFFRP